MMKWFWGAVEMKPKNYQVQVWGKEKEKEKQLENLVDLLSEMCLLVGRCGPDGLLLSSVRNTRRFATKHRETARVSSRQNVKGNSNMKKKKKKSDITVSDIVHDSVQASALLQSTLMVCIREIL